MLEICRNLWRKDFAELWILHISMRKVKGRFRGREEGGQRQGCREGENIETKDLREESCMGERKNGGYTDREVGRQTDWQAGKQAGRKIDRQASRQVDR